MIPVSVETVLNPAEALTVDMLEKAAGPLKVVLADDVESRVRRGHGFVSECLTDGRPVYGATTGFGPLVTFGGRDSQEAQCDNALQHLTAGQGPELPPEVVRATMLMRTWSLARGLSGISPTALEMLGAVLETDFTPVVPSLGSVGASGDLVPLAYVAQSLRGVGEAWLGGERLPAATALARIGLRPLVFTGRDALSMVNGTSVTSAAGGLTVAILRRSFESAIVLSALLTDVLGAGSDFLGPSLLRAFGHPETAEVGERLRDHLAGSVASGDRPLQEPYSVRCVPQLLGAARSALDWAGGVIERDLNGVSDNPLFFPDENLTAHGGNFFGQPTAFASDMLSIIATQMGNLAERQLDLLVDPVRSSGLPPMLSPDPGVTHAVQGVQLVTTAVVASMRRACVPASIQSIPTNLHNQDVVPFGTQAALTALEQARCLRVLHGSLAVGLRQAAYLRQDRPKARRCAVLLDALADVVPPIVTDRPLDADVRAAADVLDRFVTRQDPKTADN
ncbi:aromatic amino acid ammonia-lyase [Amycolatopsis oliviviridis]|uniref:Histidine ammonia-lyase n=1 Tax=Amycolatopsis oliviviridis TaxID=1471590 RepID=A0ABQ3LZL3_9PSEU|nr:aromatic amino acid ammonia-lyase [Amycolatopsis oliviviridis]GHH28270.1 histidine ammonia-lyase [Amycolatopsis oliviviridis]